VSRRRHGEVAIVSSDRLPRRMFGNTRGVQVRVDDLLADDPADVVAACCAPARVAKDPSFTAAMSSALPANRFDVCICELNEVDLLRSRRLVDVLSSAMKIGGTILLFHWNQDMEQISFAQKMIDADALAFDLPARLYSCRTLDRAESI